MGKPPSDAPVFCGVKVNPDIVPDLENVMAALSPSLRLHLKQHIDTPARIVTQGWNTGVSASRGTHDEGYCIDFVTKHLFSSEIIELCNAFNAHNFAAVWRFVGVNMGTVKKPLINHTEHIHVAWNHQANYNLIIPLVKKGKKYWIYDLIKKYR